MHTPLLFLVTSFTTAVVAAPIRLSPPTDSPIIVASPEPFLMVREASETPVSPVAAAAAVVVGRETLERLDRRETLERLDRRERLERLDRRERLERLDRRETLERLDAIMQRSENPSPPSHVNEEVPEIVVDAVDSQAYDKREDASFEHDEEDVEASQLENLDNDDDAVLET